MSSDKKKFEYWRDMPAPARENLSEKIAGGGITAEIEAHRLLNQAGYSSWHHFYRDLQEGKLREVDFLAFSSKWPHVDGTVGLYYYLLGEVKRHYTWVLVNQLADGADASVSMRVCYPKWYESRMGTMFQDRELRGLSAVVESHAHGEELGAAGTYTSIFQYGKHKDAWFEVSSKLPAAVKTVELPKVYEAGSTGEGVLLPDIYSVIPIVILDGNLLEGTIVNGTLELSECSHAFVRGPGESAGPLEDDVYLTVITLDYFETFLKDVRKCELAGSAALRKVYDTVQR